MQQDKPVFSGILLLPPQGKLLIKKTWQQRFCQLYKASKFGIERLEIYENLDEASITKNSSARIITLENCIKITPKSQTSFSVITKTASYDFTTLTPQSMYEWIIAIQSVAFRDDRSKMTSIEEDNDLYCSTTEGIFNVTLHPSEASKRCGLEPNTYLLVLTSTAIQLRNSEDNRLLYVWPYHFIRRYGHRDGRFTFEAGRKCESGEGLFHLEHSNQHEIFRCIASKMKSMRNLLNGESAVSVLDCGDSQFHAALGMEARSRSPLPPSLTTSTSMQNIESHVSSLNTSFEKKFKPPKFIPSKPPRKNVTTKESKLENYEPIDGYDKVEVRSEAWRTLGIGNVEHTETVNDNDLEEYVSWGRPIAEPTKPSKAPTVLTEISDIDDHYYDHLSFFGSKSKVSTTAVGYKDVCIAPNVVVASPPSFNDYDEVQPTIESVRIADDSHLGYALIRKTSKDVDHQFHNEDPYAIISKPKRV